MQKETEVTPWLKIFVLPGCSRLTNCTIAKRKEQPLRVVLIIYFMQHLCSKVSLSAGESVTTRTALTMKSSSSVCVWQVHKQKKPADPGNRQQNRIASDKEHRDNEAVFVQQVSKPAASAKGCRLFLPLVSSAFLAYIKILKQVPRNILAQTYSKIPCRYPGAYTGTQRRK